MRLRPAPHVRIDVRALLLVLLVGCWSAPRPTGPAALMRRQHAAGDVVRLCERGDAVISVAGMAPIAMTLRAIHDEHILAASPRRFERRYDTASASVRMGAPEESTQVLEARHTGTPGFIDDRNRRAGVAFTPPAPKTDSDVAQLSSTPSIYALVDAAYPERPIRRNETFRVRERRVVTNTDALPSELSIDVTFTVTKVEPTHVELACKGAQVERVTYGKQYARVELELACRARIARRDGRTGRWWIDATGRWEMSGERYPATVRTHYDVAVGDVDPGVCARAAEP